MLLDKGCIRFFWIFHIQFRSFVENGPFSIEGNYHCVNNHLTKYVRSGMNVKCAITIQGFATWSSACVSGWNIVKLCIGRALLEEVHD